MKELNYYDSQQQKHEEQAKGCAWAFWVFAIIAIVIILVEIL